MTTQLDIASVKAKVNLSPYHIQTAKAQTKANEVAIAQNMIDLIQKSAGSAR